ncbi:MAG TPA: prepilin-type N-terminal cleavage/methylation domain-containing protein [Desulfosalsimonadaceae bacterium]|nr:prepilin-type N-terminal cleavage/methylation domain-containing protein [Desulfosalsimonadaceae bacterium]
MVDMEEKGFTLIELLIAMAAAGIVMAAIVSAYQVQVRAKNIQEVLTDMNQNARAALEVMTHEIRMAGCDPEGSSDAGIITADPGELIFSLDVDDDGGNNRSDGDICDDDEVIRYCLTNDGDSPADGLNDNIAAGVECHLGRETGSPNAPGSSCSGGTLSGLEPLARNVDALNFVYLDGDGNSVSAGDEDEIRRIEVTLVARAGEEVRGFLSSYTNTNSYENQQGDVILSAQNDSFRRLRLTTTINCRNMGR